jgi:hypothetical protein
MNVISLSIFGCNKKHSQCFSFNTFLKYLSFNIRVFDSVYSGWKIYLTTDHESYIAYRKYFKYLVNNDILCMNIKNYESLGKSMLWRLDPVSFADRFICRDIDSLPTHRERRAVEHWIINDTLAHSMNDNKAHTVPLMGGMVGFKKNTFENEIYDKIEFDFNGKGSDQYFMQYHIYPLVKHSITEHRMLGMLVTAGNKFSKDWIYDIDCDTKCTLECDGFIKFIGEPFSMNAVNNNKKIVPYWFENCNQELHEKLLTIEKEYPQVFDYEKNF